MNKQKKTFYFFRHGQTDWNKKGVCQGQTDIPLNHEGHREAKMMLKAFQELAPIDRPQIVYSSDLLRAKQTSEYVAKAMNCELTLLDNLRETRLGEIEGMDVEKAKKYVSEKVWKSFRWGRDEKTLDYRFPGGESRREVIERFDHLILWLIDNSPYHKIALGTHGGALRNYLYCYLNDHKEGFEFVNCCVYELEEKETEGDLKSPPYPQLVIKNRIN